MKTYHFSSSNVPLTLHGMDTRLAIFAVYTGFMLAELAAGHWRSRDIRRGDWLLDVFSTVAVGLTGPTVVVLSATLLGVLAPRSEGALAGLPWWAMVGLLLIGDDLVQYAWHRTSHHVPVLYNLHRAHHSARYMSVQMMYRNNVFYYALMPSLWISGGLVHLGLGSVYVGYTVLKLCIIAGAHSSVRWDARLYEVRALRPLMWVLERVVSTPSTHNMHHGRHADDGVTFYRGNYGNMLFLWDVLFGTACITRKYPPSFGIENLDDRPWHVELMWPLVRTESESTAETRRNTGADA